MVDQQTEKIFKQVLDASFKIHTALGPGLLESAYEACLAFELRKIGLDVASQVLTPLVYEDVNLDIGYRLDLLVERKIIVEVKAVDALAPIHMAQILTYLRLAECRLGLLVNFNGPKLKSGFKCVIL